MMTQATTQERSITISGFVPKCTDGAAVQRSGHKTVLTLCPERQGRVVEVFLQGRPVNQPFPEFFTHAQVSAFMASAR
jgi:hypothetical protein